MTNDDNPYRFVATETEDRAPADETSSTFRQPESGRKLDARDIRRLAFSQRGLFLCMIALVTYALVVGVANVFGAPQSRDIASLPPFVAYPVFAAMFLGACLVVLAFVAGLFFVFAVGRRAHRTVIAVLLTLFAFSPPFALPIYLYLHYRANYVLKRHGVPVRWYGALLRSLPQSNASPLPASATP